MKPASQPASQPANDSYHRGTHPAGSCLGNIQNYSRQFCQPVENSRHQRTLLTGYCLGHIKSFARQSFRTTLINILFNPLSAVRRVLSLSLEHLNFLSKLAITIGIFLSLSAPLSYAALSATTANTIQGTQPILSLDGTNEIGSLDDLLLFSYPDGATIIEVDGSATSTTLSIPLMQLEDIKILSQFQADDTAHNLSVAGTGVTVIDSDGDTGSPTGTITGTFYLSGTNNKVTDLTKTIGSCFGMSYDLKLTLTNTEAKTHFGDPNNKVYGSKTITYKLSPAPSTVGCIEYIETRDMTVFTTTVGNSKFPTTGYNPAVWDGGKSFNVKNLRAADKDFPTTGFENAKLTFLGTGINQGLYKCTISGGGWISNAGGNGCTLTYTSSGRPTLGDDVTIMLKDVGTNAVLDIYTLKAPAPGNWAEGVPKFWRYNSKKDFSGPFEAANYCSGLTITTQANASNYFFSRSKITNAPNATIANPTFNKKEIFVRDADSTFMGE